MKEGETEDNTDKLVYVQPEIIYLAIGAKTSSFKEHRCERNMISEHYRKMFHTADFVFVDSRKVAEINLLRP